ISLRKKYLYRHFSLPSQQEGALIGPASSWCRGSNPWRRVVSRRDLVDQPEIVVRRNEPFTRFPSQAAMSLLLLHGRRHQVRNRYHRTLGIAVHRRCLSQ
ncbi:MAG: hypothetical protein WA694_16175, partial [Pseudolabrys sp.]